MSTTSPQSKENAKPTTTASTSTATKDNILMASSSSSSSSSPKKQAAASSSSSTTTTTTTTTTATTATTDPFIACEQQLNTSRRLCREQKYDEAVAVMSSTVERLVTFTGTEMDERNAPYFYEYGSVLLSQVVSRSELLGEATKRVQDEQRAAAAVEQGDDNDDGEGVDDDEDEGEGKQEDEVVVDAPQVVQQQQAAAAAAASSSADNVEDIELAWNMLEMARVLYERMAAKQQQDGGDANDHTAELELARVHTRIGDLSLESDNFEQGLQEYLKGLEIRRRLLPPHHQSIADSYTCLAVYALYEGKYDAAITYYNHVIEVFKLQMLELCNSVDATFEQTTGKMDGTAFIDAVKAMRDRLATEEQKGDLDEAVEMYTAIKERVVELEDTKREIAQAELYEQMVGATKAAMGGDGSASSSAATAAGTVAASSSSGSDLKSKLEAIVNNANSVVTTSTSFQPSFTTTTTTTTAPAAPVAVLKVTSKKKRPAATAAATTAVSSSSSSSSAAAAPAAVNPSPEKKAKVNTEEEQKTQ